MRKLKICLENCYGIRELKEELSFDDNSTMAVYASNGTMKSSLAKTFQDIVEEKESEDRVFRDRKTRRSITNEKDEDLLSKEILVVRPYFEDIVISQDNVSTLLVNSNLRKDFDEASKKVNDSMGKFIKAMKKISGLKDEAIQKEISSTFARDDPKFKKALIRIKEEVEEFEGKEYFSSVPYNTIFNEKVIGVLEAERSEIKKYIERYNELIDTSPYFKKGIFNHYNGSEIAKNLEKNGFFKAKHFINLASSEEPVKVETKEELITLLEDEKQRIFSDSVLRDAFDRIDKELDGHESLRRLRKYLSENQQILIELEDIDRFKGKIWMSYVCANIEEYRELIDEWDKFKSKEKELKDTAQKESSTWQEVVKIFNTRFSVPFDLIVENDIATQLGAEVAKLGFQYKEEGGSKPIEREQLLSVLSTGEKRAFYILNMIFDIEVRKKNNTKTLIVIDDVADSFDYRNKYAIVQYLKDISEYDEFSQLILTHNFDFFRTIEKKVVEYGSCFFAYRAPNEVKIKKAEGIKNIFVNDWKENFKTDTKKQIASIPFMRNLIEYTEGKDADEYQKLTSMLHIKEDGLKRSCLFKIYNRLFNPKDEIKIGEKDEKIIDLIFEEADECSDSDDTLLESKIVLSIAIRLKAEQYMIHEINDESRIKEITKSQTGKLFRLFKEKYETKTECILLLDRVLLTIPENIHLNAFMYEPIIDMSISDLKSLYEEVKRHLTI